MNPRRIQSETGAALPITIFIVTVLTVMLVASFTRVRNEFQLAGGSSDMVSAFNVAQSGLESYTGMYRDMRPADGDSLRINLAGGYADVTAHLIRNDTLNASWMYLVRSAGAVIDPLAGPDKKALHTVTQFAQWQAGTMSTPGALTSVGRIVKSSAVPVGTDVNVVVSGSDACGVDPTITGIRAREVPDTTEGITVFGSPPWVAEPSSNVSAASGIDWQAILDGAIVADFDSIVSSDTTYKTHRVDGEWVSSQNVRGTGLLIVTDRLRPSGSYFVWDGLVLVGGRFVPQATDSTIIRGMVVTGLSWQTGGTLINTIVDESPLSVYYDSCKLDNALRPLRGLVTIQNGWLDNWAMY